MSITENKNISRFAGIDIGSTTAKMVICDAEGRLVFFRYSRHKAQIVKTVQTILEEAIDELGDLELDMTITGSAGMGIAETFKLPFVQEVVSSTHFIRKHYPDTKTFIEIGGEDSKIVFFDEYSRPDIRMNGSCAGGTGAFIDQMAVLLDVDASELNASAANAVHIHPVASRCGVFAKTDVQSLMSNHISRADIAASIFQAVALQVITALSRGRNIEKKILIGGGPLTFYPELRQAFIRVLNIDNQDDLVVPDHPELIPAMGAALLRNEKPYTARISEILSKFKQKNVQENQSSVPRLPVLFESKADFELWQKKHEQKQTHRIDFSKTTGKDLFLGIDSGSTTSKIVIIDAAGKLVLSYYSSNNGDPIQAVQEGLTVFSKKFMAAGLQPRIVRTCVTGYGEGLIKAAFGLHDSVIETMAHYRAAKEFEPDVSFIMDIGGQDMKAISIQNQAVANIQVNEACSSGCGSFIETFAHSLGHNASDFGAIACEKNSPFDLGTRCTVFMNSKVKQAFREGASVSDISAGLAYSVIKNALYKVLMLKDADALGSKIVVQGGTFRNPAVLRALELLLDRDVVRSDIPELMGAFGAALTALDNHSIKPNEYQIFSALNQKNFKIDFVKKEITCKGCENKCTVRKLSFNNGNSFFTGNRCERYFNNNSGTTNRGKNLINEQLKLLFNRKMEPKGKPILTYGIPRCLNVYENFPFWCAFLTTCGFKVVLSSSSNFDLYEKGASTVVSENICFPAKLAHGHIIDLIEKEVDRIFFPTVVYEQNEFPGTVNSFNCPIVTGYPDLLNSAIDSERRQKIVLDSPSISFKNNRLLTKQLAVFFKRFGIAHRTVSDGVKKGLNAQKEYRQQLRTKAKALISEAENKGQTFMVLAGRPYHIDPLINHGIPDLLADMGVDVISENAIPFESDQMPENINVLTQWNYTNRLYPAAKWTVENQYAQMVQLTSFGCGLDAISTDEVKKIIQDSGKIYTLLKIDEIANLGAARIRLRSMLEAVREKTGKLQQEDLNNRRSIKLSKQKVRKGILIAPFFSPLYSPLIPAVFRPLGYQVDILPPQNHKSVEFGLKVVNNDMCYPAILVAGDIIQAFKSGRYDPQSTSVIITQTGGQCRASSYVPLIKKGLAASGLKNVPVLTIVTEDTHHQPEFEIDKKGLVKRLGLGVIFCDPLAQMYLSTVSRESVPGTAKALHQNYLSKMKPGIENADYHFLLNLLREATEDFNNIKIKNKIVPRIGVVGEIFVKYNFFSSSNIIEWLSTQGVEVILPSLQNFFIQGFVNEKYNQKAFFKRSSSDRIKNDLLNFYTNYHLAQIDMVMKEFRFYRKPQKLKDLSKETSEVVSLANQFGEGWLLTAEMIAMLNEGVGNIVCIQPFGCLSNQITGRGVEKRLKEMFPHLNLLSLDMDAGISEVNILNRLHFMIISAQEEMTENVIHGANTLPPIRIKGVKYNKTLCF